MLGLKEGAIDLFSPLFPGWQQFEREGTSQITHLPTWHAW